MQIKTFVSEVFKQMLTVISPRLNTAVLYRIKKRKRIDLKQPQTFEEKLLKLKLEDYNNNPLVKQCADKYRVREYIEKRGCAEMLNELIGVYDSFEEINFDKLPDSFALKLNTGFGCNYICHNKADTDLDELKKLTRRWMKSKPWLSYAELQYKGVLKKLLVEKYLTGKDGSAPEDYKIYCFHGKPEAILYMGGRFSDEMHVGFFDIEWNYIGIKHNDKKSYTDFDESNMPEKPVSLSEMLEAARVLSSGFPFVRVDFFESDGRPIFGELTFTPAGGFDPSEADVNGKSMAELL